MPSEARSLSGSNGAHLVGFFQACSLPGPPQQPFLRLTPASDPGSSSFCVALHPGSLPGPRLVVISGLFSGSGKLLIIHMFTV